MTAGEKARLESAVELADAIIDKLKPEGGSPFLDDMKTLRDRLSAISGDPGEDARKLGEQLGSAVSELVGKNATVNVYVTVNGK